MANIQKKYSLVYPITFFIFFAVLTLIGVVFAIMSAYSASDYNNPKSQNYDASGLGTTVTGFMGIAGGVAAFIFGVLALMFLLIIVLRVWHNKKIDKQITNTASIVRKK
jgi:hypothetical protein